MIFREDGHIYTNEKGEIFTSVTTLIHKYEPKKDWDKIAKKYSKDHGIPLEEVKAMWKAENTKALDRGTKYHGEKETELNNAEFVMREGIPCKIKFHMPINGSVFQPDCSLDDNTIYTEMMVWDEDSMICGKADEIEVVNNVININDHKTNKKIDKQGFYVRNVGYEKLLAPLRHLDNCNWNVYCLQLSLYMYMLWKKNKHLKIGKLTLNHVTFDKDGNPNDPVKMDVPYMRKEVKDMLESWKYKKSMI